MHDVGWTGACSIHTAAIIAQAHLGFASLIERSVHDVHLIGKCSILGADWTGAFGVHDVAWTSAFGLTSLIEHTHLAFTAFIG